MPDLDGKELILLAERLEDCVRRSEALIARMAKALEPFSLDRLSYETEVVTLALEHPAAKMRRRAEEIERRDAAIMEARAAVAAVKEVLG